MNTTRFAYRAANASGTTVEGEIDAPSEQGAVDALRRRALWATDVWPARGAAGTASMRSDATGTLARTLTTFNRDRIPPGTMAATMRAMSTLLASGIPLEQALGYATQQAPVGPLRTAFTTVRSDVRGGRSLAEAFRTQALFPPLFAALAETGEATGSLDSALARLAESIERDDELRARVRASLLYPSLLGIAAIVGVTVILLVVIPRFAVLLQQAGGTLPWSTRLLTGASAVVTRGWPVLLAIAIGGTLAWRAWSRAPQNVVRWHRWRLRWPVVGNVERAMAAARYTRTLALALPSGVDLLTAMRLARGAVGNRAIAEALGEAESRVQGGARLAESIGTTLPPLAGQLLDAGEASGALPALAGKAADAFDGETQRALTQAVTLIEPILILGFGMLIGFVALGLLQAIYGINASTL